MDNDIEETPVYEVDDESDEKSYGVVYPLVKEEEHDLGDDTEEEENDQTDPEVPLGRGQSIIRPPQRNIPTMKGKHHSSGVYGGTSFHQVEKLNESKSDIIENQFIGACLSL